MTYKLGGTGWEEVDFDVSDDMLKMVLHKTHKVFFTEEDLVELLEFLREQKNEES